MTTNESASEMVKRLQGGMPMAKFVAVEAMPLIAIGAPPIQATTLVLIMYHLAARVVELEKQLKSQEQSKAV